MLLRPPLSRLTPRPASQSRSRAATQCRRLLARQPLCSAPQHRTFTTTCPKHDDTAQTQTHYEVLRLPPTATAADLKKQFYILSKETHPDHNRSDPRASERFAQVSESYSILADPEKRKRYDRDVMRAHPSGLRQRRGSDNNASGSYAGSRPASGLSKRRSVFRGPPPSYFAHGKPSASTTYHQSSQSQSQTGYSSEGPGAAENLGPNYTTADDPSPFSTASVYRTQTHEDARRRDRRAAALAEAQAMAEDYDSNFWARFVVVTGIVVLGVTVGTLFVSMSARAAASGSAGGRAGGLTRADGSRRDGGGGRNDWTKG